MSKKLIFITLFTGLMIATFMLFFTRPRDEAPLSRGPTFSMAAAETPKEDLAPTQTPPLQNTASPSQNSPSKIEILESILASRNDNDPRLDTEFKNLSEQEKNLLQKKYASLEKEKLNERGTIVFLLGREIKDSKDLLFLKQVIIETPCNSFENCNATSPTQDDDHTGTNEVTLIYPQLMARKSLEIFVASQPQDSSLKALAMEIIKNSRY